MGIISFHKHFFCSTNKEENQQQNSSNKGAFLSSQFFATKNLIILDENSYMTTFQEEVVSNCNEILHTIRDTANLYPSFKQYVSILCYNPHSTRYILHDVLVTEVQDLTIQDHHPDGGATLCKDGSLSITHIQKHFTGSCAVGVVSFITEGYRNDLDNRNSHFVADFVQILLEDGWDMSIFKVEDKDIVVKTG